MGPNNKYNRAHVIMHDQEAEQYAGAFWRRPTTEELEELAHYYAVDYLSGTPGIYDNDEDKEADEIDYLIELAKEKEEIYKELEQLTMVLDLAKLDIQIFYTYNFVITATEVTNTLSFEEGMCKLLKRDGKLTAVDHTREILFDL